jgi:predicted O-methyltransferase YrrM
MNSSIGLTRLPSNQLFNQTPFFAAMYNAWQLGTKWLKYWLTASNGKGHGIHSPFVFDLVTNVLNDKHSYYCYQPIESLRQKMLADKTLLTIEDFGAGSRTGTTKQRRVKDIASSALKPKKYGQLMFRLANYYQCNGILELGTSLGITSSYLASARKHVLVHTMEGAHAIADKALENFQAMKLENLAIIRGNFDETLPGFLAQSTPLDLVYIDGNHRLEPTLNYFELLLPKLAAEAIFVFDDIHWSAEMEQAWETIKKDERVLMTIDLFFIGLVVFRENFRVKQDFTIRF